MAIPDFDDGRVPFHWEKALKRAKEIIENIKRFLELLDRAWRLIDEVKNNPHIRSIFSKLSDMFSLAEAYTKGDYRKTSWKTMLLVIAALIYFVSPVDAIPDLIPILGFADDASVIAAVFSAIKPILDDFIAWKKSG